MKTEKKSLSTGDVRLQLIIARALKISRRDAETVIEEGRVVVNGTSVDTFGVKVDPFTDTVRVDGVKLKQPKPKYLLLNKPEGFMSTHEDPQGRPTILDLHIPDGLFWVGRLDMNAEGLMILTNDGHIANRLMHPRYKVPKVYQVKVKGKPTKAKIDRLRKGIRLTDGFVKPERISLVRELHQNSWYKITLTQGKFHIVKRLFEAIRHPVVKLRRIQIANLTLGDLAVGKFRKLTTQELNNLRGYIEK